MNGDGGYNVLDIVALANCVLASNCGGRVDDANHSQLIIGNNIVSIEADGFIGGVQMTLVHGAEDAIIPASYLNKWAQNLPNVVGTHRVEEAGHQAEFDRPEEVAAIATSALS